MAVEATVAISRPGSAAGDVFSGLLLAAGAATLFVGTLFYARLTPELGLPARAAERGQALADALSLGPGRLAMAGGWAFAGDCLLLAASLALACRARGDLERAGWALIAVSVALAMLFNSMTAALFWPLAHAADPAAFLACKAWFDFLFAAGNAPFGIGFIGILWANQRKPAPLLPWPAAWFGFAIGAAAAISGLFYLADLVHLPLVIGLAVTFGCVILTALGVQMMRDAGTRRRPRIERRRGGRVVAALADRGRRGQRPHLQYAPARQFTRMRAQRKKDYHHGDLRRALIEAAVETIAKRGVDALNLRRLASEIGVTTGAPYHHFANREQLLRAIAEDGFARLGAQLIAARDAAPAEAGAKLVALGVAYVGFAKANPGHFRAMFRGDASRPTEPGLRAYGLLRDAVIDCQQEGTAPAGDPAPLVMTAWSAVHGFATLWVDGALPFEGLNPDAMAPEIGRMVARMFAALAREGGAGRRRHGQGV